MDIRKYTSYFHDGSIIGIAHVGDKIEISMESAELDEEDLDEKITLSSHSTLKGKLHLKMVKSIKENGDFLPNNLIKSYDSGEILHLGIERNKVNLLIRWVNFPPKLDVDEVSNLEIVAEMIDWENIPNLFDPFW